MSATVARTVRNGSNNLVVGDRHSFSSSDGFVAGFQNSISNAAASVSGGNQNTASNIASVVLGGINNSTSRDYEISPLN